MVWPIDKPGTTERRRQMRREDDQAFGLDREDLFLLLEAYKNTIELNTTLIERQEMTSAGVEKISGELANICTRLATMASEMADDRIAELEEHHSLTLRLYGAYAVLGAIVLGLLGLIAKIWPTTPHP
jgi:hypothetical protein